MAKHPYYTRQPPYSPIWKDIWKAFNAIGEVAYVEDWEGQSVWLYNLLSYAGLTLTKVEQKRLNRAFEKWYESKGHGMLGSPSWLQQKRWIENYITLKQYMKK